MQAEEMELRRPLTEAEYLAFEAASPVRHEFVLGQVCAQAGASANHSLIVTNVAGHLWLAARGSGCLVASSDLRLRVSSAVYYYPDVVVSCESVDGAALDLVAPCVVVEVLSPSTASTDRREKLLVYRGLPSLQAYLIVYRDEVRVERHFRDANNEWQREDLGAGESVPIPCLNTSLAMAGIYEGLTVGPGDIELR